MTLVLKIKNKNVPWQGYYLPAVNGFQIGCRSWDTVYKNIQKLIKKADNTDFVIDWFIELYDGKYESYKNNELLEQYDKSRLRNMKYKTKV